MSGFRQLNRRGFLQIATLSIGGLISLMMGIPAIAFVLGPALLRDKDQDWTRLGSVKKVEPGTPTLFRVNITRNTSWLVEEEKIAVYVLTDNGRDFIAMSNICTHLGCRVRWIAEKEIFLSPCHNGVFDREGKVISGPPPRPLDRYEVKIENNQLLIGKKYELES